MSPSHPAGGLYQKVPDSIPAGSLYRVLPQNKHPFLFTHTDVNAHSKTLNGRHVRVTATGQLSKWRHLEPGRTGFTDQEEARTSCLAES